MTPERWHVVREVLAAVVEAPAAARVGLLDAACGSDPVLRQELDLLFLSRLTPERLAELPSAPTLAHVLRSDETAAGSPESSRIGTGTRIGPYTIERLLGAGGMGEVYLAHDSRLLRRVALKCVARRIASDPVVRERTLREARAAARLTHPGIAHVHDVLDHDGTVVIVMEYVEGRPLAARLAEGPCAVEEAVHLAMMTADALEHAHAAGIVHCDVKPGNIQLTGSRTLKILDFGLARSLIPDTRDTTCTVVAPPLVAGTPGYMSPEQALGLTVDARSDVFSLGVVLFEMLAGQRPFDAGHRHLEPFHAVLADAPDLARCSPDVPLALRAVVAKALDRHPERRFQTAGELRDALQKALPTATTTHSALEPVQVPGRRRTLALASIVLGVVVLAGVSWRILAAPTPLTIAPQAENWYVDGVNAIREGAYLQATRALERAVQIDPVFPLSWARLGEAQLELDQEPLARQSLLKASALVPNRVRLPEPQRLSLEGAMAMASRDPTTALKAFSALAAIQPASAPLLIDLGRVHEAMDDVEKALEYYERASQLDSENPAPFLRMGILYSRTGEVEQATAAFDRAEELYTARGRTEGVAAVCLQRGVMFARLDRASEALPALRRALHLAESVDSRFLRAEALFRLSSVESTQGKYAEAEAKAREGLELSEGLDALNAFGLVDLGTVHLSAGQNDEAERHFRRAVEKAGSAGARRAEARARLALGDLLIRTGSVQDGIAATQAALAYYEQTGFRNQRTVALMILGRGRQRTGDLAGAQSSYEALLKAARTPSETAQQQYLLCGVLLQRELYISALHHCTESVERFTALEFPYEIAYGVLRRVDVLVRLGAVDDADRDLDAMFGEGSITGRATPALEQSRRLRKARIALVRGDSAAAERIVRAALTSGQPTGDMRARFQLLLALAVARSRLPVNAWVHIEAARTAAAQQADEILTSDTELARAEVLLRSGRHEEALTAAGALAEPFGGQQRHESAWMAARLAARAATHLNRPDVAERWRVVAEEHRARFIAQLDPDHLRLYESRRDLTWF